MKGASFAPVTHSRDLSEGSMHPIVGYLGFGLVIVGQRLGKYMIVGCLAPQGFGTIFFVFLALEDL